MNTLIIAEAGVNHNGDIEVAKQLIVEAANAGADLIKFQSFVPSELVTPSTPLADYQKDAIGGHDNQFNLIKGLELSRDEHLTLLAECKRCEIGFCSTAFDNQSLNMLASLDCLDYVKIASGELNNLPLIRSMCRLRKPILLSTGMSYLGEVEAAIKSIEEAGILRKHITVLHCTSAYPAPSEDINLRAMEIMRMAFGVEIGYSDHSLGIEIPVAAVALGATVIEKHFTLDRSLPGPDHAASLEPDDFRNMVCGIRKVESALGTGLKQPSPSEMQNRRVARKSIVAIRPIKAGERFDDSNIGTKRPGIGISPMCWDEILGKKASRDFDINELIEL